MPSIPPSVPRIRLVQGDVPSGVQLERNPALARYRAPLSRQVFAIAGSGILFAMLGMMGWLADRSASLGQATRDEWLAMQRHSETRFPPRGQIYDRNGLILGETLATHDCWAVARDIDPRVVDELATMLSETTSRDAGSLKRQLEEREWRSELFRDMNPELTDALISWKKTGWRKQALKFSETVEGKRLIAESFDDNKQEWYGTLSYAVGSVVVQQVDRRHYPLGSLGGQVLGFVTERPDGIAPGGGIELSNQQQLAGDVPSVPVKASDALSLGKPALGVKLTLDADAQAIAEQALARGMQRTRSKAGVAIIMDADSGDILAMANCPVFDPAIYQELKSGRSDAAPVSSTPVPTPTIVPMLPPNSDGVAGASELPATEGRPLSLRPRFFETWPLSDATLEGWTDPMPPGLIPGVTDMHRRNAALQWQVEPGSIFKPFIMLSALEHGTAQVTDTFPTGPAPLWLDGYPVQDHHNPPSTESWDATKVMVKSSNKGMARIALKTGRGPLLETIQNLHFGDSLLGLPGEGAGQIGLGRSTWRESELGTFGFGHGLVTTTPLQLTAAMNAIATGSYINPRLIMAYETADGRWREQLPAHREATFDPIAIAQVQHMLEAVVGDEGTGKAARVDGFSVAGKTGTAKKIGAGGYMRGVYYSSFLGYGPIEAPRYTVLVMYDEPQVDKYGGQAAAPVFSEIMGWLLQRDLRRPKDAPAEGSAETGLLLARR